MTRCAICHDPLSGDGPTCGAEMCATAWEVLEWFADAENVMFLVHGKVVCAGCNWRVAWHEDDCLHLRAAALLASRGTEDS